MTTDVMLHDRAPTLDEYRALCDAVGWSPVIDFEAAQISLARSLVAVVAVHEGRVVGMGRLVGDGAMYAYLQDLAVDPVFHRRGIGDALVARLVAHARARLRPKAFLGVFATAAGADLYRRHGFERHAVLEGMFQVIRG